MSNGQSIPAPKVPLRLAYMVPLFPSQTHAFFWREISSLRQLGCEIFPVSTFDPGTSACRHAFAATAREETVYLLPPSIRDLLGLMTPGRLITLARYAANLKETPLHKRSFLLAAATAAVKLKAYCEERRISHLHVHSCGNSAHIAALAKLFGGPTYSLTLHGDLAVYGRDHLQKMKGATFVSAVTNPLKQQIMEKVRLGPGIVPVIWMGVDVGKFTPKRHYAAAGPIRMITVARLNPSKGHRYALEAMRKAIDAGYQLHYDIVGDGDYCNEIKAMARDQNLLDHVSMTGTVSEDRVCELLKESDIFLLTSFGLGEAAPVSVMEAMACGLPVICSQIGGTSDMIRHGENGLLVHQQDVDGIYEALVSLITSSKTRQMLGQAARNQAQGAFDYRRTSQRLLDRISKSVDPSTDS